MKRVDARGLSCPEPVIRAKNAMESGDKEYEILVDNVVAKENVSRFALHQGYKVSVKEEDEDDWNLVYLDFPNIEVAKAYLVRISDFCTQIEAEETLKESRLHEYMLRHIRALYS